jgi:hypothetical protein
MMRSLARVGALVLLLACAFPASGQLIFYDDFDGNELLPHWSRPPASCWSYTVADSMLTVRGLHCPSNPHSPANVANMGAYFPPQSDFRVDAWMGWEGSKRPRRFLARVLGPGQFPPILAQFGYHDENWSGEVISAGGTSSAVFVPAPPPGMYQFTIMRIGNQTSFYLDGALLAAFPDNSGVAAGSVGFEFLGPYPGQLAPFYVDRIQIIPAPGSALVGACFLGAMSCRRRLDRGGKLGSRGHSARRRR